MKQQMLKERVELLAIGETLGYPRLGIGNRDGHKLAIRAGQSEWEKFCGHAHSTRIPAALRIGRILRDNGVTPYNPRVEVRARPSPDTTSPQVASPESSTGVQVSESPGNGRVGKADGGRQPEKPPIVLLDDPIDDDPMVTPKRSKNALRQARWRAKQKEKRHA